MQTKPKAQELQELRQLLSHPSYVEYIEQPNEQRCTVLSTQWIFGVPPQDVSQIIEREQVIGEMRGLTYRHTQLLERIKTLEREIHDEELLQ